MATRVASGWRGIFVVLDWPALEAVLGDLRAAPTGRPGYPPLVMLRVLLLAQWYGLSDPELEEALADRLSFRRFAGLPLDGPVPDETTICRFRGELVRRALSARLLAAVEAQLAAKGLVLRRGTLIDATLIEADADVRKGPDGRPVTVEREAGFARRRGRAFFGFKAHLAVDQGSGLVRRTRLTAANVNETLVADALILGDEAAVYADKAYDSLARRAALAACGIGDGILRRGNRRPLTGRRSRATGRWCRSGRRSSGCSAPSSATMAGPACAIAASLATPPISTSCASPSTCAAPTSSPADLRHDPASVTTRPTGQLPPAIPSPLPLCGTPPSKATPPFLTSTLHEPFRRGLSEGEHRV